MDREALRQRCTELSSKHQWQEIDSICRQVLAHPDLPDTERADWMRCWANWSYHESTGGGRVLYARARALLGDAIPLAKNDPALLARIYVLQTAVSFGDDLKTAARRFWRLRARYPAQADPYAGYVYYNLGFKAVQYAGLVQERVRRAANYYRQATRLLTGRLRGQALQNYAHMCIDLGRFRAAERALAQAKPLLDASDQTLVGVTEAWLAALRGQVTWAIDTANEVLGSPQCGPVFRAYALHVLAVSHSAQGKHDVALRCAEEARDLAADQNDGWLLTRCTQFLEGNGQSSDVGD